MVLGAPLELTGTPREARAGGAEGGAKVHRHTTGILYLSERCLINHHPLQHLLWLPGGKKENLCWTLPIGLICPLVPGLGPASLRLPGQHPSPDRRSLVYGGGGLNTPRHSSYQSQASRHHPLSSA